MDITYREVGREGLPQLEELWDYCFEKKEEPFFRYYFHCYCCQENTVIGGFRPLGEGEALASMAHLNPYQLRLRGRQLPVPYLVGLAVAPELRGRGLLRELVLQVCNLLRAQGGLFALLLPVYAGLYQPYRFAYCYLRHHYHLDLALLDCCLPQPGPDYQLERLPEAEAEAALPPLYEAYSQGFNGVPLRGPEQWRKLLAVQALEGVERVLVRRGEEACGYMFYQLREGSFQIQELASLRPQAQLALLRYAVGHASSAAKLDYLAAADDLTYLYLPQQQASGSLAPFMMARCLNPRAALQALPAREDLPRGSLILRIQDDFLQENNQLLRLNLASGRLEVQDASEGEDLSLGVDSFCQLYFGTYSATELYRAGRLTAAPGREGRLALLEALLPKARTWINEYF